MSLREKEALTILKPFSVLILVLGRRSLLVGAACVVQEHGFSRGKEAGSAGRQALAAGLAFLFSVGCLRDWPRQFMGVNKRGLWRSCLERRGWSCR